MKAVAGSPRAGVSPTLIRAGSVLVGLAAWEL